MPTVSWNAALPWRRGTSPPPDSDLNQLATAPVDLTIYARMDPQCLGAQGDWGQGALALAFSRLISLWIDGPNSKFVFLAQMGPDKRAGKAGHQHWQFDGWRHGKNSQLSLAGAGIKRTGLQGWYP